MKKEKKYQLVIFTLLIIAVLEAVFLITLKPKREIKAPPAGVAPIRLKGKIAFVMDDWGYNLNNMHALGQIRYPLTLSILPGLNYSRTIAEEGKRLGQGIILQ